MVVVDKYACLLRKAEGNSTIYISLVSCPNCGKERAINKSSIRHGGNGLCLKCTFLNPHVPKGSKRPIEICKRMSVARKGTYTGDKNPNWNPNLTSEERELRKNRHKYNPMHRAWSRAVKERDNFTCQITGIRKELVSHHFQGFDNHPDLRFDINNGITLHVKVHHLFHSIYGNGDNTKTQFEEFKLDYFNGKFKNV